MVEVYRLHGPPGTGKTQALSRVWIPRAAEKVGRRAVCVCSLTRAAAAEIGGRADLPAEQVGTVHSFAFRALARAMPQGQRLKIATGAAVMKDWAKFAPNLPMDLARLSNDAPFERGGKTRADRLFAKMEVMRQRMVPIESWPPTLVGFRDRWCAFKADRGLLDFTDLIEQALERDLSHPLSPRALMVDEAQDVSRLEMSLIRRWAEKCEILVLVGDGDQAIYQWRGADADVFAGLDVPEGHDRYLRQSYRVPVAPHALARAVIRGVRGARHAVDYEPKDEPGLVRRSTIRHANPGALLHSIAEDVEAGCRSVMLLATCGYMLNASLFQLRRAGVPFHNPYRRDNGAWNPLRGGASRLAAFLGAIHPHLTEQPRPWTWAEFARWSEHLAAEGTIRYGMKGLIQTKAGETPDDSIPREDLAPFFEPVAWAELAEAAASLDPSSWLRSRILKSKWSLFEYAFRVEKKQGPRALLAEPRVVVGTIHSVKGGEADSVYVFPDLSQAGQADWFTDEGHDGILRTIYVGVTRTRDRLTLCSPSGEGRVPWPIVGEVATSG